MRYILGLTLQSVNYSAAIEESLKIDFLVLMNTERDYARTNDQATFYLVTMNTNVAIKVGNLLKTYEQKGFPDVILLTPDYTDIKRHLTKLPGSIKDFGGRVVLENATNKTSKADVEKFTRAVGRSCLLRNIKVREKRVKEIKHRYLQPPGLNWDYFGVIEPRRPNRKPSTESFS